MHFLDGFKRCFEAQDRKVEVIDHGDPEFWHMSPNFVMSTKPTTAYVGPWIRHAPNGEGDINIHANRAALEAIAPLEFWKLIEHEAHEGL